MLGCLPQSDDTLSPQKAVVGEGRPSYRLLLTTIASFYLKVRTRSLFISVGVGVEDNDADLSTTTVTLYLSPELAHI